MIARLRPIFALFLRAVRDDLRARFPPILRTLLLLVLLLAITATANFSKSGDAGGLVLLEFLAFLNLAGLSLLGVATFASTITEEKADDTLELLRLTRLNPLAILLGKSGARLLSGLLLLLTQIPFVLLCVTLGGVTVAQVFRVYAILASYLAFLCGLGVLCSVLCRRTASAIAAVITVGIVVFTLISTGIPVASSSNPIADLTATIEAAPGSPRKFDSIPFLLFSAAAFFALAWASFDRFCDRQFAPGAARATKARVLPRLGAWPVFWKDYYLLVGGRRGLLMRSGFYLFALGFASLFIFHNDYERSGVNSLFSYGWIGFSLEIGLAAHNFFGQERRHGTLGTLVVTRLSLAQIVRQKSAAHVVGLLPGAICNLTALRLQTRSSPDLLATYALHGATWFGVLALYVFYFALIVFLSLRLRRGALLAGLVSAVIVTLVYQAISNRCEEAFPAFFRAVQIAFPCILLVSALFLSLAIPRQLACCAGET